MRNAIGFDEVAPKRHSHAEHLKQVGGGTRGSDPFRLPGVAADGNTTAAGDPATPLNVVARSRRSRTSGIGKGNIAARRVLMFQTTRRICSSRRL